MKCAKGNGYCVDFKHYFSSSNKLTIKKDDSDSRRYVASLCVGFQG
jgi:hypothetical protein